MPPVEYRKADLFARFTNCPEQIAWGHPQLIKPALMFLFYTSSADVREVFEDDSMLEYVVGDGSHVIRDIEAAIPDTNSIQEPVWFFPVHVEDVVPVYFDNDIVPEHSVEVKHRVTIGGRHQLRPLTAATKTEVEDCLREVALRMYRKLSDFGYMDWRRSLVSTSDDSDSESEMMDSMMEDEWDPWWKEQYHDPQFWKAVSEPLLKRRSHTWWD